MAEIDDLDNWIVQNAETAKGTPEFVQKAARYRELRDAETSGALPDAEAELRARRAANPGGFDATMNRMFSGAVTGLPDLGIGITNMLSRVGGRIAGVEKPPQIAPLGPQMIEAGGGGVVQDPSTLRQLLEGAGSALIGGGAGGVANAAAAGTSALNTAGRVASATGAQIVAPTVTSHYGGEVGGYIGEKLGDRETGALLGSIIGGAAPTVAQGAGQRYSHNRLAAQAAPNAAEIAAAAAAQDVRPTAGMLGNRDIQNLERTLGNQVGSMGIIDRARRGARADIGAALDRLATERGSTHGNPTPGTIGENAITAARESAEALRAGSEGAQMRLQDRVGADTPVAITPMRDQGYSMMTDPRAGLSVPKREAIDFRLTEQLAPLINRDAAGMPILQGGGRPPPGQPGPPPGLPGPAGAPGSRPGASETVPYGPFRGWRTDLGRSLDTPQGGRMPPTSALYGPATEAMRVTAENRGVPRQDFQNVQGRTHAVEREGGDYQALQQIFDKEPQQAFNYLTGGEQNPVRLGTLEATQHPQVNSIMGDILRYLGNDTINHPAQGARGPANLANEIERMHPDARATIAGPQLPGVMDVATLARALDYPTSQTGLGRTVGGVGESVGRMMAGSETLGQLGTATGIPGAGWAGRIAGLAAMPAIRALRANYLQGDHAINALGRGAAPPVTNMAELVSALNAAAQQREQQQLQPGPRVP